MMLHGASSVSPATATSHTDAGLDQSTRLRRRKRKADTQDNERLSKRLSLLNLEKNGNKLYVPVETPATTITATNNVSPSPSPSTSQNAAVLDDTMQLDDSKHKVYIYNIDDELSSDSDSDDAKLVFLPDIDKHLRANRIPPSILANKDGELAGMQVVLYSDPKSLSVPEDKDSVRKAIIESRRRMREQQRLQREGKTFDAVTTATDDTTNDANVTTEDYDPDAMDMD